jgi:Family of unknown function (DUF5670)
MLYALWVAAGTLLLFWLAGVAGAFAAGPWVHVLLVAAIAAVMASVFSRPRVV